jgi:hypothetical protein
MSYRIRDTKITVKPNNDTRIKDYFTFSPTVTKRNYLIKKSGVQATSQRKSIFSDVSVDNYKKGFEKVNLNKNSLKGYFN